MAKNEPLNLTTHHRTHWYFVRRRRTRKKAHTASEILVGQLLSLSGAAAAGLVLEANKSKLAGLIGAYMILPGVFDLSGSTAGAMGARINHSLTSQNTKTKNVIHIVISSLLLVGCSAVFLAFFSMVLGYILFGADLSKIFLVTIGSVVFSSFIGFPIVALVAVLTKRKNLDPDNFIGPIESSIFDMLSIVTITFMIILVS